MRRALHIAATGVFVAALCFWLAAGAHWGWTQTQAPHRTLDEVTGIEGVTYEKKFVPGIDFLAAAILVAAVLGSASFLFRKKQRKTIK